MNARQHKSRRMMPVKAAVLLLSALIVMLPALHARADGDVTDIRGDELVRSMSSPVYWKPHAGLGLSWNRFGETDRVEGEFRLGIYKDLLNPAIGAFGLNLEGYAGSFDRGFDGGVRLLAEIRFFMLQLGYDYLIDAEKGNFMMSLKFPPRRGGLFGLGDQLRIDYWPTRGHSLSIGLDVPLSQPWMGKTRQKRTYVNLPKPQKAEPAEFTPSAELKAALDNIGVAMNMLSQYTVPFFDQEREKDEKELGQLKKELVEYREFYYGTDENFPNGRSFDRVIRFYHGQAERAFALAAGTGTSGPSGERIWLQARRILLEDIVIPYNNLLGRRKKRDTVTGLGQSAEARFREWMGSTQYVSAGSREAAAWVFRSIVEKIETERDYQLSIWDDSRLVWLPMHFALKPEEHDSQEELDSIIEMAVGQDFSTGNDVHYVINEQFQEELARMIHAARDYHVLWIHDYRGLNAVKEPDRIGYGMTVEGYLQALIDRVRDYDTAGRMPVYLIFIDQIYFEANKGIIWLKLLEDPLGHELKLKKGYAEWEEVIRSKQEELRKAVAESKGLQEGLERYGEDWLRNRVKVQINVTNPADFSFRTAHLVKYLFFMPDIVISDHRKISFYDVTELDPSKGEAIYTGMGVGEHYAGATWEDRALLARGPALVTLKDAAREMLMAQGFKKHEIPGVLQQQKRPSGYGDMVLGLGERGWIARAMQVHSKTGYATKKANVIKAITYNLMPAGSHMYIPDSLWNSFLWGGLLTGASMRGCKVVMIAPSLGNAPSSGLPQMSRANELFTRFIMIQNGIQDIIADSGGLFKVGIYDPPFNVDDQVSRGKAVLESISRHPWLRELIPFDQSVYDLIDELSREFEEFGYRADYLTGDVEARRPKLHRKTQLFLSGEAVNTLMPLPGWREYLREYALARAEQVHSEGPVDVKKLRRRLSSNAMQLVKEWEADLSPENRDRVAMYLMVGSHNQNYRSLALDGEVAYFVSGLGSMIAYLDFVALLGSCTWVESVEQLDELVPPVGGSKYGFSRGLKKLF